VQKCSHILVGRWLYNFLNVRPFTEEEKKFISDNYQTMSIRDIASKLGRSEGVIKVYASSKGINKIKVRIGDIFGKLKVVDRNIETTKNGIMWICECECGNKSTCATNTLTSGHSSSCGCGRIEAISSNIGFISGTWYGSIKKNAKARGLEFLVSQEYLNNLLIKQDHKCALSGLPIEIKFGRGNKETTASLDRIDNSKPYTEENVQFVHKHINYMKWTHDQDYFLALCRIITIKQDEIIYANSSSTYP
jgi:hypothetical protein